MLVYDNFHLLIVYVNFLHKLIFRVNSTESTFMMRQYCGKSRPFELSVSTEQEVEVSRQHVYSHCFKIRPTVCQDYN